MSDESTLCQDGHNREYLLRAAVTKMYLGLISNTDFDLLCVETTARKLHAKAHSGKDLWVVGVSNHYLI